MNDKTLAITYTIYIILYEILCLGSGLYIVFGLKYSGWWLVFFILISSACFKPDRWRELYYKKDNIE